MNSSQILSTQKLQVTQPQVQPLFQNKGHWTNKVANHTKNFFQNLWHTINNPDAQKWFLFTLCIPGALFVLLSPGLIINIPRVSVFSCQRLVPFPLNATGTCNNGVYTPGTSDILTGAQGAPICLQQKNCHRFSSSEYTSVDSIVVHGLVFVFLLVLVRYVLREGGLAPIKGHN